MLPLRSLTLPARQLDSPDSETVDELARQPSPRITSIDAYRGLVMFLMVAAGMALYNIPKPQQFDEAMSGKPEWVPHRLGDDRASTPTTSSGAGARSTT